MLIQSTNKFDNVGETITYTYTVTNSGNIDISAPITVTDDKFGTVTIQNGGTLSPGSSITGTSTYKITDADINTGSVTNLAYATGSINVLTPVQAIDQIIASIQKLITSGNLSSGVSRPLISQLNAAKSNLNSGQTSKATTQLNIFITEVDTYINSGILSQTNGQLLIDATNAIIQA